MTVQPIRYAAWTYSPATQNPDTSWNPPVPLAQQSGEWGTLRIEAGAVWDCTGGTAVKTTAGTDITTVNGVPTLVESLSFGEPYGELTGSLTVSEPSPWDDPAAIGLYAGSNVDIYRVLPAALATAAGTAEVPYWHGFVASMEWADGEGITSGLSVQLVGALYGEALVRAHQPYTLDEAQDATTWAARALNPLDYGRPLPPYQRFTFEGAETGIELRCRGSRGQSVIDYMDELLALTRDDTHGTWTISRAFTSYGSLTAPRPRHYFLRRKQEADVHSAALLDWTPWQMWPDNPDPYTGTTETSMTATVSTDVTGYYGSSIKIEYPANTTMSAMAQTLLTDLYGLDNFTLELTYTFLVRVWVEPGGSSITLTAADGFPAYPVLATSTTTGQWETLSFTATGMDMLAQGPYIYLNLQPTDWTVATTVYVDSIVVQDYPVQTTLLTAGGYGVGYSLSTDVMETPTAIYGEGVHPVGSSDLSGSRWRNSKWPMLAGSAPAYPSRVSGSTYPIQLGDEDADFTAQVITQVQAQLRAGGWPDVRITGTFDADTVTALNALYATVPAVQDGKIANTGDWDIVFGPGTGYTDGSGYFAPLYDANPYYSYNASGDVIGTVTGYDETRLRVEETISYGEGVAKSRAIKNARRIVNASGPDTVGSITLTYDGVDEAGTARSRMDVREGGWVQLAGRSGVEWFYVSGVTVSPEAEGLPVSLTVASRATDLLALSTKIERNKAAKADPARSFYNQRSQSVRPFRSAVGWDAESGAGLFKGARAFAAAGSAWGVARITGAQYGSIEALRVTTDPPCAYAFAVFGGSVSASALGSVISAPLGSVTGDYPSWWQHPDNLDWLDQHGFIEAWGSYGEAAGYYPGAESIGSAKAAGSVTGTLEDAGSWQFASLEPPFLWVACWPRTSGTVTVSGQMKIAVEE